MRKQIKSLLPYRYLLLVCVLSYLFFSHFATQSIEVSAQGGGCPVDPQPRTCSGYAVCTSGGNCGQLAFTSCCVAGPYPTNTPVPTITGAPTSTLTPTPSPTTAPYLLQAAYRFNNSGNLGQSSLGSGIDGTNNGVTYITSGAADGGSGSFNGTSSYISIPDNAVFNQPYMSVSAWAKLSAVTTSAPIFNRRTAGNVGGVTLELGANNTAICYMYIGGAWRSASTANSSIVTSNWFKLTCTYDGTNLKIYKDGTLAATTAISGTINNPSSPSVEIGRNIFSPTTYLNGALDEICVYGKGLTSAEVTALTNASCDGTQSVYPLSVPIFSGTGGTITDVNGYRIHTFTTSGTFTPNIAGNVEVLVVGGGGAGRGNGAAGNSGDGGSAGGLGYNASLAVAAQAYSATVGSGGTGVANAAGSNGGSSIFSSITATGGTGGQNTSSSVARNGGAGAGGVGGTGSGSQGGAGGVGLAYSISGSSVYYAGGGGGGFTLGGLGGNGGGGRGENYSSSNAADGTANTGGGGGGVSNAGANAGKNGGSGIVIIRYPFDPNTPTTAPTPTQTVSAVGGTITDVGGYRIHTFTSSGTLTVVQPGNIETLIVAGGGGGGNIGDRSAGGGGAGGLKYSNATAVTAQGYPITVGPGGVAVTNGTDSSAFGITSTGGGKGGTGYSGGVGNGGSGGGCIHNGSPGAGTGIAGQGNNGGSTGYNSGNGSTGTFSACGGGGAGAVGGNASTITGGAGGVGLSYSISGSSVYYAGGGGGGVQNLGQGGNIGVGGNGGGGNGAINGNGSNGTANTGGGGGGAGGSGTGGTGGSGVVIVRYPYSAPIPTPTTAISGCNPVTWTGMVNVNTSNNTIYGTADSGVTTMSNGAKANFTATPVNAPGGYAIVPAGTQSYRAMWGLSSTSTASDQIDFAWLLPYYTGANKAYVSIPGINLIDMGIITAGDAFGVQVSNSQIIYTKLPSGSSTWQSMYVYTPTITYPLEFRGRVEDYAQVYNAFAGTTCQMVAVPTPTPAPTGPTGGGIAITPWYSQNLSTYPEHASGVYPDSTDSQYIYMVGRRSIGYPYGWGQSSAGYIQKIRKSDKALIWSRETGTTFSAPAITGGIYDVKDDTSYVYISGYDGWGTLVYLSKLNKSDGTVAWQSSYYQGSSWNGNQGNSMALDANYIYVQAAADPNDSDTNWQIMKYNKSNGSVVSIRQTNINNPGYDAVSALAISGTTLIAAGGTKGGDPVGRFYIETINTATMAVINSISSTGTFGHIGPRALVLDADGLSFYVAGTVPLSTPNGYTNTSTSQVRVEKRLISDLSLVWSYTTPETTERQISPVMTSDGNNLLIAFTNNYDYTTGFGSTMRLYRISFSGYRVDDYLYYGPSMVTSAAYDMSSSSSYITGATVGRTESAVYRLNELYNVTPTPGFGLTVSQSTPSTITQGSPIQWSVDISNSSIASQAAWAFTFNASIPQQIKGVVWSCAVVTAGTPTGEMAGYPTRCSSLVGGSTTYDAGSGTNKFTFGHTSNADPLIHPGGKIRITLSGVVAANTPAGTLNATMSITNYQGWPTNHYYTTNFLVVNGPTPLAGTPAPGLYTLIDSDMSDNQSTLAMALGTPPPSTPTPTSLPGVATPTPTITLTPSPTPTPPAVVIANCSGSYLRTIVDGQAQYYCKTTDSNFILIKGSTAERLNGSGTKVTDVTFTNVGTINGEQLVRVDFTIQSTTLRVGSTAPTSKTYSLTVRLR